MEQDGERTKVALRFAVALPARPRTLAARAVNVRVVLVSDLVEEVDLVLVREQGHCDAVYRRVAPALRANGGVSMSHVWASGRGTHLVVEAAGAVEVLEEFRVRLVAPEVHARDLEVAPDCARAPSVSIFRNANEGYVQ